MATYTRTSPVCSAATRCSNRLPPPKAPFPPPPYPSLNDPLLSPSPSKVQLRSHFPTGRQQVTPSLPWHQHDPLAAAVSRRQCRGGGRDAAGNISASVFSHALGRPTGAHGIRVTAHPRDALVPSHAAGPPALRSPLGGRQAWGLVWRHHGGWQVRGVMRLHAERSLMQSRDLLTRWVVGARDGDSGDGCEPPLTVKARRVAGARPDAASRWRGKGVGGAVRRGDGLRPWRHAGYPSPPPP